jgi:SP family galactose:H+ symporter-like MFS transporter
VARERNARLRRWALAASLGGFVLGYQVGVVGGALLSVRRDFGMSAFEQGLLVSLLPLGAMVGSVINSRLADAFGRRRTLMLDAVVFLAGAALAAGAPDLAVLFVARGLSGLAVGSASAAVPLYLSEIAPTAMRGRLVTTNQVLITSGVLGAYLVALAFPNSWRAMFAAGLIPAAAFLVAMKRCPETPAWLQVHGDEEAARRILLQVVDDDEARPLLDVQRPTTPAEHGIRARLRSISGPPLVIGLTLAVLQQLSGINVVFSYGPSIMETTGLSASGSILAALVLAAVNVGATFVALPLVDRVGRRPLLLLSLAGMAVTLALFGVTSTAAGGSSLSLVCLVGFIFAFEIGMGPIFWLLAAEIFRADAKATGVGACTAVNWLANFGVGLAFPSLAAWLGHDGTFWIFAAACALGFVFVLRFVPETKARTFSQIDAELRVRFAARRRRAGSASGARA